MTPDDRPVVTAPVSCDPPEPVSVIMPVHDRAELVTEGITSVLHQDWPDIELVVIDDGSTDNTAATVEAVARDHPRVHLVCQSNRGPGAARNTGLARATHRLVTFLDSDDLMWPGRIGTQVRHLATHPEDDLVIGVEHIEVAPGVEQPPRWVRELPPPDEAPRYYTMSMMLDRAWIDHVGGFDETTWVGEDVDLLVRLRAAGARLATIDDVLLTRRIQGDNLIYREDEVATSLTRALHRHRSGTTLRSDTSFRPPDRGALS